MMNRCHSWAKMICVCLMVVKVMVCWHDNMSFVITTDKSDFYNLSVIIYEDCCIHLMALKLRLHPIFCNLKTMFCFLFMFLFLFTSVPYRVNMNKTKVMMSGERQKVRQKAVRWPCGVCSKGVGSNSLQCTSCQKWVHKKCSGIQGSMSKVAKSFICRGCLNPVTSAGHTSVDIEASAKLELVNKFCYIVGMLSVDGDADAAVEARIRIGWNKFRQLVPLLTNKDVSPHSNQRDQLRHTRPMMSVC